MKVHVIGLGSSQGDWLQMEHTKHMAEADVVILTGGEDINPELYNEPQGKRTHFSRQRDAFELEQFERAKNLGKVIFGICRGAQFLCAMAGGKLVQDLAHPSHHDILMWDGTKINTTSCHHQLQLPYNIDKNKYKILAYAEGLSSIHLNGEDERITMRKDENDNIIEPELVYYKELKALGIQGHPEWMGHQTKLVKVLRKMTELLVEDKLDLITSLNMDIERILAPNFEITEDEYSLYANLVNSNKKVEDLVVN